MLQCLVKFGPAVSEKMIFGEFDDNGGKDNRWLTPSDEKKVTCAVGQIKSSGKGGLH